jgi:hypothetical protein
MPASGSLHESPSGANLLMHRDVDSAILVSVLLVLTIGAMSHATELLSTDQAQALARLAMAGIEREYPNKPSQVMTGPESVATPRELHPAFYGCFDWHSAVHGHWMLLRLLKLYPDLPISNEIRQLLGRQLTEDKLLIEAQYFDQEQNRSFERTYGWAWALRLALELRTWDDPQAQQWAENLAPLEEQLVALTKGYLPRLTHPIRTGVHPDTGFALAQMLDYARGVHDAELETEIVSYAKAKYWEDRDYPAAFEPSGEDFFSSALNEADLMRRVLASEEFAEWLERFLPGLGQTDSSATDLLVPVLVSDVTDPKLVHMAGLNLSRAWCVQGILHALPADDARRKALSKSLDAHTKAGLSYVFSGHYEGEHWLGTFAVYLLTMAAVTE